MSATGRSQARSDVVSRRQRVVGFLVAGGGALGAALHGDWLAAVWAALFGASWGLTCAFQRVADDAQQQAREALDGWTAANDLLRRINRDG
jgi:hypothetical protein